MALNPKQRRFVDEFLIDLNGSAAALRAGYSETHCRQAASRMLDNPKVLAAVKEAMAARSARTFIDQDRVLQHWWNLATADANELVEYRRLCCRHCWGVDFAYQRTAGELKAREAEGKPTAGLDGDFDARKSPNEKCPECFGEGEARPFYKDTRDLSPGAQALYAGVKVTKEGIEVKMHSQEKAWEMLSRHLNVGVERQKHEISGPGGAPVQTTSVTKKEFEEIAARLVREV